MEMDEQTSIFQDTRVRALGAFVLMIAGYFLLGVVSSALAWFFKDAYPAEPIQNSLHLYSDALICLTGLAVWLAFFAQFVLPVKTFSDRLKVVDRLVTYLQGGHGPALFIENGIVRAKVEETKRKGPGVIWLDSASAAMLSIGVEFKPPVGPGVYFTDANETIAATADLHQLTLSLGPLDGDFGEKDPFRAEKAKIANDKEKIPEDYEAIQKRRWETSAMTRDGIEVVATISVTFRIAAQEGEGNTRFGFNQKNAERAIRDSITPGADLSQPVWSPLPARMAVDVWREYLGKFRLSELFETSDDRKDTGLQLINTMIGKRLKQKDVDDLDNYGRVKLKPPEECRKIYGQQLSSGRFAEIQAELDQYSRSDEFAWQGIYSFLVKHGRAKEAGEYLDQAASREFNTLSGMGLQVVGVSLKRVIFAPDIEERLISQWTTQWKKNAEKERDQVERNRKQAETKGQEDALKEYATEAAREFQVTEPANKFRALYFLVHNTFLGVRRNSTLLKRTSIEQRLLSEIFSWLRDR